MSSAMQHYDNRNDLFWIAVLSLMLALALCISSCSVKREIVREVSTDTLVLSKRDTIRLTEYHTAVDTFFQNHLIYIETDSLGKEKSRKEYHDTYRSTIRQDSSDYYRSKYDSILHTKRDSVPYPVYIEKKLSKTDSFILDWFNIIIGMIIIITFLLARRFYRWLY